MRSLFLVVLGMVVVIAVVFGAKYFLAPTKQTALMPGHIEGTTNYPSDFIPVEIVCVEPTSGGSEVCGETVSSDDPVKTPPWGIAVPPGTYYVSARVKDPVAIGSDFGDYRAYYTRYVTCGLKYECTDHGKIPVTVTSGQTTSGIMPYDWYIR